jgi:LysM repeat protein
MNTSNPFQIPACLQRADINQRRRDRFKKGFIAAIASVATMLVALLIEGCVSEHTQAQAATPVAPGTVWEASAPANTSQPIIAQQNPQASPQANPIVPPAKPQPTPVAMVQTKPLAPAVNSHTSEVVYTVKSGDTLSRIAHTHHSTVKAIKSVNGLASDLIIVGAKLKIPSA